MSAVGNVVYLLLFWGNEYSYALWYSGFINSGNWRFSAIFSPVLSYLTKYYIAQLNICKSAPYYGLLHMLHLKKLTQEIKTLTSSIDSLFAASSRIISGIR